MPVLTNPRNSSPERPDDLSGHAHRQLIGYLGLLIPFLLVIVAGMRPIDALPRWGLLDSISAYYYSGASDLFVGLLVALGLFLLTYRGYRNRYRWADRSAAIIAGVAALGVAFFPTKAPAKALTLDWCTPATAIIHYVSAVVLFAVFAVYSLWLFRLAADGERPTPGKRRRNRVCLVCGIVIVAGMAWALLAALRGESIFWPETVALAAFAVSWLVKGRAYRSIRGAARAVVKRTES